MDNPEKDIAEAVLKAEGLSASRLGLRFDRVVVRVMGRLRAFVEHTAPEGVAVAVTISAPIHVPGRTAEALNERIDELLSSDHRADDWSGVVHGNQVSLRRVEHGSPARPRLVGFVHNPGPATPLLDLAEQWLRRPI